MKKLRLLTVVVLLLVAMLPGTADAHESKGYTCKGGAIPPGTYSSLTIAGVCSIPSGTVVVHGSVTILPGKSLNAALTDVFTGQTAGNLVVYGGLTVQHGGILILGCSPSLQCTSLTNSKIYGGLRADRPLALILHGNTISGGVSVFGGGGGLSCEPNAAVSAALGLPPSFPAYTTFENSKIQGGVSIVGMQSCWLGFIRNEVRGTVSILGNKMAHPDAMEIVTNTIRGSLACYFNDPKPQVGDSMGDPNKVTGAKLGQCKMIQ